MPGGVFDLIPVWTAIMALSVFLYVLLDGFDLGVGMLYAVAPPADRATVMNAIAPVWDGNETWLVLGGLALLSVFPLAFAIIIPAVYFPILLMLLALVFRGVAFEFRHAGRWIGGFWSNGFWVGSCLATFAQGIVLGAFVQGFTVHGRSFVGSSWDWLTPFSMLTGVALMLGYGLLGACWLVIKTEGSLQAWARRMGRLCLSRRARCHSHRQSLDPIGQCGYCATLVYLAECALSLSGASRDRADRMACMALARGLGQRCFAVLCRHWSISYVLPRHRYQPLADDRAAPLHVVAGGGVRKHAGLSANWYAGASAGNPDVHRVVILGVPRENA